MLVAQHDSTDPLPSATVINPTFVSYEVRRPSVITSNTAGGYCFYKDARLRRITRYRYNSVPLDPAGRYFYINDGGDVWNPRWAAASTTTPCG